MLFLEKYRVLQQERAIRKRLRIALSIGPGTG
jgi:hypothetical protein